MTKQAYIVSLLFLLMSLSAFGQDFDVEFIKVPNTNIPVGQTESIVIKLTNRTSSAVELTYQLETPPQWLNLNGAKTTIELESGAEKRVFFTFRPASSVKAGDQELKFTVSQEGHETREFPLTLNIQKTFRVSLSNSSQISYAISGTDVMFPYTLINRGNTPTLLRLKTIGCEVLNDDPDSLYLQPGELRHLQVNVSTPSNLLYNEDKRFKLEVVSNEFDTSFVHYEKIEVYPSGKTQEDSHIKLPVRISMNYLGRGTDDDYISAFQGDIFGKGSINKEGTDVIEFHMRGPDRTQYSTFGNFEEYYIKYKTKNYGVWVGDQVLRLSRLTEFGRYVRGVSGFVKLNNTQIEASYGKARFFPYVDSESALKLTQSLGKKWEFGGGMLYKQFKETDSAAVIPMAFANYVSDHFSLETEGSYGRSGSTEGYAYRIQTAGKLKKFRYTAGILQADAFYPGFLQNSIALNSSAGYTFGRLNVSLNGSYNDRNPSLDTFFVTAPFSYSTALNLAYRIDDQTRMRLTSGQRRRKDRMSLNLFDYKEDFVRFNFNKNYEQIRVGFLSEYQWNINYLLPAEDRISKGYMIGGSFGYKIGEKLGVSTYANYLDNSRYSNERFRTVIFSLQGNWEASQRTRFGVSYQNNYDIEDYYQTQDYLDASVEQRVGQNHLFTFSGRYSKPRGQGTKQVFVNAKYTYEFGMPIRRIKGHGKVKGRLTMNDSIPLKGVVIRISGQKAVTDKDGYYVFPKVLENFYFMTLDRTSFNIELISETPQPYRIDVVSNQTQTHNINLVSASHIKGSILIPENSNKLLDEKNTQTIPIYMELKNEKESFIKKIEPDGSFEFNHLRPGKWDIRIIKSTIDKSLEFRKTEESVELKPGETRSLQFKARKKQKKLKLVSPPLKLTAKRKGDLGGTD